MEIQFEQLIRTIRKLWYVPVVLALVLALLGFGMARMASVTYSSTTQILVTTQISGDPVLTSDSRTETYLNLTTSGPVLDRVILELGLDLTREELRSMIETSVVRGTQIIEITVTSDDAELSAEIANSLARNFVSTATDLSVGEVQRNLDELIQQANSQRDQLVVIEARIDQLDTEENADDSHVQAEIAQLERQYLQTSQTLADLDRNIRDLTTSLSTMSIPVVVTDFATPSERGQSISPVLAGLLGGFAGGLIGAAWITFKAFVDRTLRSSTQVISMPVFTEISKSSIGDCKLPELQMLATRISGVKHRDGGHSLALVSAREQPHLQQLGSSLDTDVIQNFGTVVSANGALENPDALRMVNNADAVLVVATIDETSLEDLEELHRILDATSTHVLGTVVITT